MRAPRLARAFDCAGRCCGGATMTVMAQAAPPAKGRGGGAPPRGARSASPRPAPPRRGQVPERRRRREGHAGGRRRPLPALSPDCLLLLLRAACEDRVSSEKKSREADVDGAPPAGTADRLRLRGYLCSHTGAAAGALCARPGRARVFTARCLPNPTPYRISSSAEQIEGRRADARENCAIHWRSSAASSQKEMQGENRGAGASAAAV